MKRNPVQWIVLLGSLALLSIVVSCGGGGSSGDTSSDDPQTPPSNVIISLSAVPNSPGSVALSWNAVGSRRYYWVFMDGYLYTQIYQFAQESPVTAVATRLHANHEYCFRVVAYTESPYLYVGESSEVCTVTPVDTEPPDPPAYLKSVYSSADNELSLTWPEATDNAWVASYRIYRNDEYLQEVSGLSFLDTNLGTEAPYCYQVTAIDDSGNESSPSITSCVSPDYSSRVAQVQQSPGASGGVKTSLALDADGNAHLSFYEAESKDLFYATNAAGEWAITTIATGVFGSPSLALDSLGKVHIAFASDGVYSLKYATNVTGDWVVSTIDSSWVGLFPALAVDTNDKVHISYYDYQNGYLKYATNSSGAWLTQVIDNGYAVGKASSIAIGPSGEVHISYYDEGNVRLKYATNATGAWLSSTLDDSTDAGSYSALVADGSGKVHIAYYDMQNRALKYATGTPGFWTIETLDSGDVGGTGWNPSLFLDASGTLHISYNDWGYGFLRYITNTSGVWETYVVGAPPSGGGDIWLDAAGMVHVSYQEGLNIYYLIYAVN